MSLGPQSTNSGRGPQASLIFKLMPILKVPRSEIRDHSRKVSMNYELKTQSSKSKGFSLIELMIVVSLFGIAAALVTASYLNFEKNNRVKNAAATLKNDLRLVQNKALTGDKGPKGTVCNPTTGTRTLGGWYLKIQSGATQTAYSFGGVCYDPDSANFAETSFEKRTVRLPADLIINRFAYDTTGDQTAEIVIFFRPLKSGLSYLSAVFALPTDNAPDFFDDKGVFFADKNQKVINPAPVSTVTLELSDTAGVRKYLVKIEPTGEINEAKP